jgi:hypothetical protein
LANIELTLTLSGMSAKKRKNEEYKFKEVGKTLNFS